MRVHEGPLLCGKQLIIPYSSGTNILRHIHYGHQVITKTGKTPTQCGFKDIKKDINPSRFDYLDIFKYCP